MRDVLVINRTAPIFVGVFARCLFFAEKPMRLSSGRLAKKSIALVAAVAAASGLCAGIAQAEPITTWNGSQSGSWNNGSNWTGGNTGTYGELLFNGSTNTTMTDDVSGTVSQNQLIWSGTSSWTLNQNSGSSISLFDYNGGQAKIENDSTGSVTLNANITFAANNGSPPNPFGEINAVSGDLIFGSTGTLTVNGSSVNGIKLWGGGHNTTFNNTVSASGKWFGMTATGVIMNIGGSFTANEIYVMNSGTLNLNSGSALTVNAIRLGGDFGNTGNQNQTLGGTVVLNVTGGGKTVGTTLNAVSGNTSGALVLKSVNTAGINTWSGGIFLDSSMSSTQAAGGTLTLSGGIDLKGNTFTVNGAGVTLISSRIQNSAGTGNLIMGGAGTLVLSASNSYSGSTTVNSGTLQLGNVNALFSTSGVTIASGAVLDLAGQTLSNSPAVTIDGTGIGATGALINSSSTAATFSGQIDASGTHNFSVGGVGNITLSGELGPGLNTLTKVGANTVTLSGATDNTNLAITANAGKLILSKTSGGLVHSLGSGLTIGGAIVQLGNTSGDQIFNNSSVAVNSGVLDLNGANETVDVLSGSAGTITNTAGSTISTLTVGANNGTGTYGGTIVDGAGVVALAKSGTGTLILSGTSAYTGGTSFAGGTLESQSAAALGTGTGTWTLSGGNLTADTVNQSYSNPMTITGSNPYAGLQAVIANGVTLTLGGNLANNGNRFATGGNGLINLNGTISGTGDLLKQGAGTLVLNGANGSWAATNTPTNTSTNIFMDQGTVILLNSNAAGATNGTTTGRIAMGSSNTTGLNTMLEAASGVTVANPIDSRFFTGLTGGKTITDSFSGSGSATYSGAITLHDTTTFLANSGTTVTFSGGITVGTAGTPYGTVAVNTLTLTSVGGFGNGPGLLINDGTQTGTIELTSASTFSDETILKSGTLQFNGSGTIDNSTIRAYGASTINIANTDTVGSTINPQAANVTAGLPAFTGKLSATNFSGTATFSGHVGLDANTTFFSTNAGANLAFTSVRSGTLTTSGIDIKGHTLTLDGAGNIGISGTLYNSTGSGTLIKNGTGTTTLSGSNTYAGPTTVNNGVLVAGSANGLSPNSAMSISAGKLDVTGFANTVASLAVGASGTLAVGLGNTLTSTAAATLAGTLNINGSASLGNYTLIAYPSKTGVFSTTNAASYPGYKLIYNTSELDLQHKATASISVWAPNAGSRYLAGQTINGGISGTVTNTAPTNSANLTVNLSNAGNINTYNYSGYNPLLAPGDATDFTADFDTGNTLGNRTIQVTQTDAPNGVSVTSSSFNVDIVATRALTNAAVKDLGRMLTGSAVSVTSNATGHVYGTGGTGAHLNTEDSFVDVYGGSPINGLTLTGGPTTLNTNADITRTISGNITGTGTVSGTFTLNVTPELSAATTVDIAYTANPVAQRTYDTSATVAFGNLLRGASVTGTDSYTSPGTHADTTDINVQLTAAADGNGIAVTGGTANVITGNFNRTLGGTFTAFNAAVAGSQSLTVSTAETFGDTSIYPNVNANYTANVGVATSASHTLYTHESTTNLNQFNSSAFSAAVAANGQYGATWANRANALNIGLASQTTRSTALGGTDSSTTTVLGTTAVLLAGVSSGGNTVGMTWRDRADNEAGPQHMHPMLTPYQMLASDVVKLTGLDKAGGQVVGDRIETDIFALSLSYDPSLLPQLFQTNNEAQLAAGGGIYMGWLDTGAHPGDFDPVTNNTLFWRNAVDGNFGGASALVGFQGAESWATFYGNHSTLAADLGDWGVDTATHTVWAVLNHNSEFAIVVPEPTTLGVLCLGATALLSRRRKR
jgi:fibronectin-binding autotransporter adhesin